MPKIDALKGPGDRFYPMLRVELEYKSRTVEGLALVDSGADFTVLSAEVCTALGIRFERLPKMPRESRGAGGQFEVRVLQGARLRYRGVTFCERVLVAAPGSIPWPLLGRDDFMAKFPVKFHWHKNPPWIQVDIPGQSGQSGNQRRRRKRR